MPRDTYNPLRAELFWGNVDVYTCIHGNDVIMSAMVSQITSLTIVYSTVHSGADQRKASLAFVRGIHREPVNFPHKWPVTRKIFPFDDVIMLLVALYLDTETVQIY